MKLKLWRSYLTRNVVFIESLVLKSSLLFFQVSLEEPWFDGGVCITPGIIKFRVVEFLEQKQLLEWQIIYLCLMTCLFHKYFLHEIQGCGLSKISNYLHEVSLFKLLN